ncbi:MAG: DUF4221 family protein [Mediterranea sp.]|jgi:hypothetical protein|nr:DUF4221 family protein [Mediterranea sp.]
MKYSLIVYLLSNLLFISCTGGKKQADAYEDKNRTRIDTLVFSVSDVLNLKSYHLSSACRDGTTDYIYAYNDKAHALDKINLTDKNIRQIPLATDGKDAIGRYVLSMLAYTPDSIWLYDNANRLVLLNNKGEIRLSVDLGKELKAGELIATNQNYSMANSHFYYDNKRRSLLYGITDRTTSPKSFKVRETFLSGEKPCVDYPLQAPLFLSDISNYGWMSEVNINFTDSAIVYNYPAESTIFVMDRTTGKTSNFESRSRYTNNVAEACTSKDYTRWESYQLENPHFYDVVYLPKCNLYARLHLDKISGRITQASDVQFFNRQLYLMLFSPDFSVVGEYALAPQRYDYCNGWCATEDALCLYVNNILDETAQSSEGLTLDRIYPPRLCR